MKEEDPFDLPESFYKYSTFAAAAFPSDHVRTGAIRTRCLASAGHAGTALLIYFLFFS